MKKWLSFLVVLFSLSFNSDSMGAQWIQYAVESEKNLPVYYDNTSIITLKDNIKLFWMALPKEIEMAPENIPIIITYDNTTVELNKLIKEKSKGQSLILTEFNCDKHTVKFMKYITYDKNSNVVSRVYSDMNFIPILENTLLDNLYRIICNGVSPPAPPGQK